MNTVRQWLVDLARGNAATHPEPDHDPDEPSGSEAIPWEMVVITPTRIRFEGRVRMMTERELDMARWIVTAFPSLFRQASRERLAARLIVREIDDVWDLDARIAELQTRIRATPAGGVAVDQNLTRPLFDPLGGAVARGNHVIVGASQLDSGAYGLTWNEGGRRFSFYNVSDAMHDEYAGRGRTPDVMVHETAHQLQDATRQAGQPEAASPGGTGMPNPDWAEAAPYGFRDDPRANWMHWYDALYDAIDYGRLAAWAAAHPTGLTGPFAEDVPIDTRQAYRTGAPRVAETMHLDAVR